MGLGFKDLHRLSTLLDEALDLDAESRAMWLVRLRHDDQHLKPTLQRLLEAGAHEETRDLLERGPSFTAGGGADELLATQFSAGEHVGPYRLERAIGRGGMGEVWLAVRDDGQLKRSIALKLPTLSARRALLVQRFARERDILGTLAHPHIARLYDAGVGSDGQPYLALEYVEGQTVTAYCNERQLDLRARVTLLLQVLAAVQYAHANLVIHRDLKPSNVLVTAQGQAMLLDFGIAKLLLDGAGGAEETELTRLTGRAMTLVYAAPEQVSGAPISIATDVWALGVLLYEVLSDAKPFTGKQRDLERAILEDEPARPQGVPADLATIILKTLKKAPLERYATVAALAEDLQRWLANEPVFAQPDSTWYRTRKFVGRNKLAVATATGVLVTVFAASGVSIWQARVARTEAQTAEAVQNFMEDIFRASSGDQIDPVSARRRTAKELLDEGAARIDRALADSPVAKLRMLKTLGGMYEDMEQLEDAARLHEQRAVLALRYYGPGSSTEVEALSHYAYEMTALGRTTEADAILKKAAAIAARGHADPDALVALYLAQGWLGQFRDRAVCVDASGRAVALLRQRSPSQLLVQALEQHGLCLALLERGHEALVALNEALELAGHKETRSSSTLTRIHNAMGKSYGSLGEIANAERSFRAGIESAKRYGGVDSHADAVMYNMLGQFLGGVPGRGQEALQAYEAGQDRVSRFKLADDRDIFTLRLAATASKDYLRQGRLAEVSDLLDRADAAATRQPKNLEMLAMARTGRASLWVEQGRYAGARRELDAASGIYANLHLTSGEGVERLMESRILLEERTGHADAMEQTWRAWRLAHAQAPASLNDKAKDAYLACRVKVAQRATDASKACEAAIAASSRRTDRSAVDFYESQIRLSEGSTLLETRDASAAVPILRAALTQALAAMDPERSQVVLAIRTRLAEALVATGDSAGAQQQLALAKEIVGRQGPLAPFYIEPVKRLAQQLALGVWAADALKPS